MNILQHFKQEGNIKLARMIYPELTDNEGAWACFDGAAQGDAPMC